MLSFAKCSNLSYPVQNVTGPVLLLVCILIIDHLMFFVVVVAFTDRSTIFSAFRVIKYTFSNGHLPCTYQAHS